MFIRTVTADWQQAQRNLQGLRHMQIADRRAERPEDRMEPDQRAMVERGIAANTKAAIFCANVLIAAIPPANESNYQAA